MKIGCNCQIKFEPLHQNGGVGETLQLGGENYSLKGSNDIFIVRYEEGGDVSWATHFGTSDLDNPAGFHIDDDGRIVAVASVGADPSVVVGEVNRSLLGEGDVALASFSPSRVVGYESAYESVDGLLISANEYQVVTIDSAAGYAGSSSATQVISVQGRTIEQRFDIHIGTGAVYGTKYEDLNNNGRRDSDDPLSPDYEPPVEGAVIGVDINNNGLLDPNEPTAVTDVSGSYVLAGLSLPDQKGIFEHQNLSIIEELDQAWRQVSAGRQIKQATNNLEGSSYPEQFTDVDEVIYFVANDLLTGEELWKFDPTSGSSELVADIRAGVQNSNIQQITSLGGKVFFIADDGINGQELWFHDPASSSTQMLEVATGSSFDIPKELTVAAGKLYFVARDSIVGEELWEFDPATNVARSVTDLRTGNLSSSPEYLIAVGNYLAFKATGDSGGREIWTLDLANDATTLYDVQTGSSGSNPQELTSIGSKLYFSAFTSTTGYELFVIDPLTQTTGLALEILAGSGSSSPYGLTEFEGQLVFNANDGINGVEPWIYDPVTSTAKLIADVSPGSGSSNSRDFVTANGKLLFTAFPSSTVGNQLWSYDPVFDVAAAVTLPEGGAFGLRPSFLVTVNDILYFYGYTDVGTGIWMHEPSSGLTTLQAEYQVLNELSRVGERLYFGGGPIQTFASQDIEPRFFDTSTLSVSLMIDVVVGAGSTSPKSLAVINDSLYFSGVEAQSNSAVWSLPLGGIPQEVAETWVDSSSQPGDFTLLGSDIFFSARNDVAGQELWKYNPVLDEVSLVADIFPGTSSSNPRYFQVIDDRLYFWARGVSGDTYWVHDPIANTTTKLVGDTLRIYSFNPKLVRIDDDLYFTADDGVADYELWKYNLTTGVATLAADINPTNGSVPTYTTELGGKLYFRAQRDTSIGQELWTYDPVVGEASLVADIRIGSGSSVIEQLTIGNGQLYFVANDGVTGKELWFYDPATDSTSVVADVAAGAISSNPVVLSVIDDKLFFRADDGVTGIELWMHDLGSDTTTQVADINPGIGSSSPSNVTLFEGQVFFAATDGVSGSELWSYDPNASVTSLFADINRGSGSSAPNELTVLNNRLYFAATDELSGTELFFVAHDVGSIEFSPATINVYSDQDFGSLRVVDALPANDGFRIEVDEGDAVSLSGLIRGLTGNVTATWIVRDASGTEVHRETITNVSMAADSLSVPSGTATSSWSTVDDGDFTAILEVLDGNSGLLYTDSFEVRVRPLGPSFTLGDPLSFDQGSFLSLPVNFTDPGQDAWTALVDYGTGNGPQPIAVDQLNQSLLLDKRYFLDGNYQVTVTIRDTEDDLSRTEHLDLTVDRVAPLLDITDDFGQADAALDEGQTLLRPIEIIGSSGTWTIEVDYGDGSAPVQIDYTGSQLTGEWFAELRHRYVQDGVYTVNVDVIEDGFDPVTQSFQVVVANLDPEITELVVEPAADITLGDLKEGDAVTLLVRFADDGWNDAQTVLIDWGDSQTTSEVVSLVDGMASFLTNHTYQDNNTYQIRVTISDEDGDFAQATETLAIDNVSPQLTDLTIDRTVVLEGQQLTLTSSFQDPGVNDSLSVTVDWNDGTAPGSGNLTFVDGAGAFDISHTYRQQGQYQARITINDGVEPLIQDVTINVQNVGPLVSVTGVSQANEGDTLSFTGNYSDPGLDDTIDFRWEVFADNGDLIAPVSGSLANGDPVPDFSFTAANQGRYIVRLVVNDGVDQSAAQFPVQVSNVVPTSGNTTTVGDLVSGDPFLLTGQFFDAGFSDQWSATANFGDGVIVPLIITPPSQNFAAANGFSYGYGGKDAGTSNNNPPASVGFYGYHAFAEPGTYDVKITVRDRDGGTFTQTVTVVVESSSQNSPLLVVDQLRPTQDGFEIEFNRAADLTSFELYGSALSGGAAPTADLELVAASTGQSVPGSVVYDAGTATLRFIASGGALPNDTYTISLSSGFDSILSDVGQLLDGNGDGVGGDDFTDQFTLDRGSARFVSFPDLTLGGGQAAAEHPLIISQADGIESFSVEVLFDPALLTITGFHQPTVLPSDWLISTTEIAPGQWQISGGGTTPLTGSHVALTGLELLVPGTAPLGASQLVQLSNLMLNGNQLMGIADAGLHHVAYASDASGNKGHSAYDAALIQRLVDGFDTGFDAYPLIDPKLIADANSDGLLTSQDARWVAEKSIGITHPEIIDIPAGVTPDSSTGPEALVSISSGIYGAAPGETGLVKVDIDNALDLLGTNLEIGYDSAILDLLAEDVSIENGLAEFLEDWSYAVNVDEVSGKAKLALWASEPHQGTDGTLATLEFSVAPDAVEGVYDLTIDGQLNEGGLEISTQNGDFTVEEAARIEDFIVGDGTSQRSMVDS
ncbi:MAG: PKD domain-containing protein, partial [bacterium]|nr:PKD domain-containing protein [bacterium]